MEENLANRSRAELETALLEGSRALQATLAAQQRGFDGEQAWGPWTLTAGVGTWGIPRGRVRAGAVAGRLQASSSTRGASVSHQPFRGDPPPPGGPPAPRALPASARTSLGLATMLWSRELCVRTAGRSE